ncbi:lipopolysaccharide assembly protein LapB [Methanosphaera sp. BMS]|uniref:tetratricopeptide repeat protein n=1 Tax=Methanosphaera sp. BMS TaxID=1789762 RepID=UPI0013A6C4C3|nr:hypothetical protein [Methanosphaera sp. BMS]
MLIEKTFGEIHENPEKSLDIFNEILKREPNNIKAINGKASALMKLKQTSKAEKYFNKSLSIKENSSALINLGIISKNRDEYEKAWNYFDNAIKLKPELSDVITVFKKEIFDKLEVDNLDLKLENFNDKANKLIIEGLKNEKKGKYWDALDSYENALIADSSSEEVMFSLIKRLNVHFQNELIYEDKNSENIMNNPIKRKIAEIIIIQKRPKKATNILNKALTENPNDLILLNFKGGVEFSFDNYQESIRYFDKCLNLDSHYVYAAFNKSIVFRRLERYEDALEILDNLLERPEFYNIIRYQKSDILKKVQSESPP